MDVRAEEPTRSSHGSLYRERLPSQEIRLLISTRRIEGAPEVQEGILSYRLTSHTRINVPKYNALSYAWHEPCAVDIKQQPIVLINGAEVEISPNLFVALQKIDEIGSDSVTPYWWIDALCINQSDLVEQESQVLRMHEVYREALYVVVWLGPDHNNDAYQVREFMRYLVARYEEDPQLYPDSEMKYERDFLNRDIENDWRDLGFPEYNAYIWEAMVKFWDRRWFQRLWVEQEVSLAETVHVFCGNIEFTLFEIVEGSRFFVWSGLGVALITKRVGPRLAPPKTRERMVGANAVGISEDRELVRGVYIEPTDSRQAADRLTGLWNKDNHSLVRIYADKMYLSGKKDATDPRDKVFAVLVLMKQVAEVFGAAPIDIAIDYTASVGEIYRIATTWIINQSKCLGIFCHLPLYESLEDRKGGCSWAPDYSLEAGQAVSMLMFTPIEDGAPRVTIPDPEHQPHAQGNKLNVSAKRVGRVVDLGDKWRAMIDGCFEMTSRVLLNCPMRMPRYNGLTRLEVWRKTLCGEPLHEQYAHTCLSSNSAEAFSDWLKFQILREIRDAFVAQTVKAGREVLARMPMFELLAETDDSIPRILPDWGYWQRTLIDGELTGKILNHRPIFTVADVQGRVLCRIVTEDAVYLGYGPETMQEDDELWIAAGAALPLALRKRPCDDLGNESWAVLGEVWMINHLEIVDDFADQPWQRIVLV